MELLVAVAASVVVLARWDTGAARWLCKLATAVEFAPGGDGVPPSLAVAAVAEFLNPAQKIR